MKIEGEIAVITGGASGIGRASALALARRGADIVVADVHEQRLAEVAQEVRSLGRRVLTVRCDVSVDRDVEMLARRSETEMGAPGIVMNNAGVVLRGALEEIGLGDWQWVMGINFFGVVRGIRAFLPGLVERRHGYMVNTGSVSGLVTLTGEGAPYIASKYAVVGLTEALALYARPLGIGVSLLCPGGVRTNLAETGRSIGMTAERQRNETRLAQSVQGGRELEPEEVGEMVAEAILADRFLILPEDYQALVREHAQDIDAFVEARLRS
ncbi:MAG TPA: SDR family NAD(P)-dependent oxidoreductase [Chloroflexota bacterium]|nr:SDR family NAD(P)-dependent oxidoreductase [Chloroflexota bacterium]